MNRNPTNGNGEQRKLLNSLKPVVKIVAVVAAREAGVYLYRLALNKVPTERIRAKVKSGLSAIRRDLGMEYESIPDEDIQNGVDPEGPNRKSQAAQRRQRDGNGRFTGKSQNQKGGDTS